MGIVESIYQLYQETGEKLLPLFPGKLRIFCEKHPDLQTGGFSVSLEILVPTRVREEEDYGLVFSTNAQKKSHYGTTGDIFAEGLYLTTDLSTSEGIFIDEIGEFNYLPYSDESNDQIWNIVNEFTLSKIDAIKPILLDRYPELVDK